MWSHSDTCVRHYSCARKSSEANAPSSPVCKPNPPSVNDRLTVCWYGAACSATTSLAEQPRHCLHPPEARITGEKDTGGSYRQVMDNLMQILTVFLYCSLRFPFWSVSVLWYERKRLGLLALRDSAAYSIPYFVPQRCVAGTKSCMLAAWLPCVVDFGTTPPHCPASDHALHRTTRTAVAAKTDCTSSP